MPNYRKKPTLFVGGTFAMEDNTEHVIKWTNGQAVPLFKTAQNGRDAWFTNGTHANGIEARDLVREVTVADVAPALGKVRIELELDLDAKTGQVKFL